MPSRKGKDFEFTLGKVGLALFTFVISVLLLCAFMFGVIVGKNIESYPQKIAKGIPTAIKQKIIRDDGCETGKTTKQKETTEDFSFTFYDTLSKRGVDPVKALPQAKASPEKKTAPAKTSLQSAKRAEKPLSRTSGYIVQIASFRDKSRMEKLRSRLLALGYSPVVDKIRLKTRGTWYRLRLHGFTTVVEARRETNKIESTIKGLKCLVVKDRS